MAKKCLKELKFNTYTNKLHPSFRGSIITTLWLNVLCLEQFYIVRSLEKFPKIYVNEDKIC